MMRRHWQANIALSLTSELLMPSLLEQRTAVGTEKMKWELYAM
jgi:hypothetical protein